MEIFLRAKHWQLFLLTFGIPFLLQIVMMAGIFSHLMQLPQVAPDPMIIIGYFKFFPVIMVLYMGTMFGWQWSVATGLQKMAPAGVTMKVKKFKIFFFIPVIYLTLLLIFLSIVFSTFFSNSGLIDSKFGTISGGLYIFIPFMIIIPLHLFAMFCIFYSLYFVAKTYKTVELQREVTFGDFVGEFFLTWFFPIGVWILQPKINKLIKEYNNNGGDEVHEQGSSQ